MNKKLLSLFLIAFLTTTSFSSNVVNIYSLIEAMNDIRTNPTKYAAVVKSEWKDHINSNNVREGWNLQMIEANAAAVDEAIAYLKNATAVGTVAHSPGLTMSAYEHSKYQVTVLNGTLSHTGPTGREGLFDRSGAYISGTGWVAENIIAANKKYWSTETLLCLALIIDDGVSGRGHRENFMHSRYHYVGIGIYPFANKI